MFIQPKACHFAAYHKGIRFCDRDPVGLDLRWAIAGKIMEEGVNDLIHLSPENFITIEKAVREFNNSWRKYRISVQLDTDLVSSLELPQTTE